METFIIVISLSAISFGVGFAIGKFGIKGIKAKFESKKDQAEDIKEKFQ